MSETVSETAGKVVWFELSADDTIRARSFYGRLFGWLFEPYEGATEYYLTSDGGGAIESRNGNDGPLLYFGTPDLDTSLAQVWQLGGKASEPGKIPGIGRYADCVDTEGNRFGLYESDPQA
jgi:predicted enzyme related to lactoylglutathione lyase